ncbi:DUF1249 domain-containing protein [Aquisalimonas sp.]|uniref:DUF1249 domain-containing protein n=1 Tax=Aquisalimonas sp. TaxID=1872621 RepID=UPI0025C2A51C|nr:DUF1249 domain-containing protein [Aquisalimonas sp.]
MFQDIGQHSLLQTLPARSFATLMELYESNYIQLRRLAPELHRMEGSFVSRVADGADLHLQIIEQTPYTTSVALTHYFSRPEPWPSQPDLRVRIYHDARAGEVMPDSEVEHFDLWGGRRPEPKSLEWRWGLNRFLNRWLQYCLSEGHGFTPVGAHTG